MRALRLHLVDTNAPLRAEQQRALGAFAPAWHERFDEVPPGPALIVANEFFDALPVRQFQKTAQGWRERMVGLAPDGETLVFALAPGATPFARYLPDAPEGAQAEISEAGRALAAAIGERLMGDGGWALIVDYGYDMARVRPCRRCAVTRAPVSSTVPARPTSAPMSTSQLWRRRQRRRPSGRSRKATSCAGWESCSVRKV